MKRFKQSINDSQKNSYLTFYPCLSGGRPIPGHVFTVTMVYQDSKGQFSYDATSKL